MHCELADSLAGSWGQDEEPLSISRWLEILRRIIRAGKMRQFGQVSRPPHPSGLWRLHSCARPHHVCMHASGEPATHPPTLPFLMNFSRGCCMVGTMQSTHNNECPAGRSFSGLERFAVCVILTGRHCPRFQECTSPWGLASAVTGSACMNAGVGPSPVRNQEQTDSDVEGPWPLTHARHDNKQEQHRQLSPAF